MIPFHFEAMKGSVQNSSFITSSAPALREVAQASSLAPTTEGGGIRSQRPSSSTGDASGLLIGRLKSRGHPHALAVGSSSRHYFVLNQNMILGRRLWLPHIAMDAAVHFVRCRFPSGIAVRFHAGIYLPDACKVSTTRSLH